MTHHDMAGYPLTNPTPFLSIPPPTRISYAHHPHTHTQAKIMSTEFKAIDGDERARWDQLAAEDKERYNREMEDYTPPSDDDDSDSDSDESDAPKKKKKRKKKDPNAPKRAKSAFMFFSMAMRPQIKEENPDATFGGLVSI